MFFSKKKQCVHDAPLSLFSTLTLYSFSVLKNTIVLYIPKKIRLTLKFLFKELPDEYFDTFLTRIFYFVSSEENKTARVANLKKIVHVKTT